MQQPTSSDSTQLAPTATGPARGRRATGAVFRGGAGSVAALLGLTALASCGVWAPPGDCGPVLSAAECTEVRTQLGRLDDRPPPDATNRFGRCQSDGSSECLLEEAAAKLGHRLFYDRCLSIDKSTACVTCHDPEVAYVDGRARAMMTAPTKITRDDGVEVNIPLPLIKGERTWARIHTRDGVVPETDRTGAPLAYWDSQTGQWLGVTRRPQSSYAATPGGMPQGSTPRHSPTLFNIAYGAGLPPSDGRPVYGAIATPWDGRYDSSWSLVADVFEFGATQGTDRAHIALRVFLKHRAEYEAMMGKPLPDMQRKDSGSDKYVYARHGSPTYAKGCWYGAPTCDDMVSLPPSPSVRDEINDIFVNSGKALGAFMRQLRSANSPYDRWLAGDSAAISLAAQRGLRLFVGKAECVMCHSGPNFTDWEFHNIGVPADDIELRTAGSAVANAIEAAQACFEGFGPNAGCPDAGRFGWQQRAAGQCEKDAQMYAGRNLTCQRVDQPESLNRYDVRMDCYSTASDAEDKAKMCNPTTIYPADRCLRATQQQCESDGSCRWIPAVMDSMGMVTAKERCVVKAVLAERGQFKTPSLRNIAMTFPYMHNGSIFDYGPAQRGEVAATDPTPHLRKVVEFYNRGGEAVLYGTLDSQIHRLNLSPAEIDDLVEFLKALSDDSFVKANPHGFASFPSDLVDLSDCPN